MVSGPVYLPAMGMGKGLLDALRKGYVGHAAQSWGVKTFYKDTGLFLFCFFVRLCYPRRVGLKCCLAGGLSHAKKQTTVSWESLDEERWICHAQSCRGVPMVSSPFLGITLFSEVFAHRDLASHQYYSGPSQAAILPWPLVGMVRTPLISQNLSSRTCNSAHPHQWGL